MLSDIINCIRGTYVLKIEGRYPERLFNIASNKGIYIYDVNKNKDGLITFCVSRKGGKKLFSLVPDDLNIHITQKYGLPFFISRYRKRAVLFILPILFLIGSTIYSSYIWDIDISGGNKDIYPKLKTELKKNGVYIGAIKNKISQNDVKRNCILNVDEISWLWVDIKGTTAYVTLHEKTKVPGIERLDEPADVYSTENGVIESMQTFCGIPLVTPGTTVEKGQMLITGVLKSEKENIPIYFHHASGNVIARVWKEKTVNIPKFLTTKVPTGQKQSVYGIKFKNNLINFSINSGISYREYDKIDKNVKVPFVPISFFKTDYHEVNVNNEPNDIQSSINAYAMEFKEKLEKENASIQQLSYSQTDNGSFLQVKFTAECLMRIDKEIPINKGDYYGENN